MTINTILNPYGILSNKHKLQGWCPRIYSMKYAETKEIKLINKINFKRDMGLRLSMRF